MLDQLFEVLLKAPIFRNETLNPTPAIALLRIVAALLVMAAHLLDRYFGLSFYAFGTGAFFVLAGALALHGRRLRGKLDSKDRLNQTGWRYLARRLIRLYPGYALAVGLYLLTLDPAHEARVAWEHFTLFFVLQDRADVYALNPAFWCMPVFVCFYALVAWLPNDFEPKFWQVIALWLTPLALVGLQVPQWVAQNAPQLSLSLMIILYVAAFALGAWVMQRQSSTKPFEGRLLWIPRRIFLRIAIILNLGVIVALGFFYKQLETQWALPVLLFQYLMIALFALLLASLLALPAKAMPQSPQTKPWWLYISELSFGVFLYHNLIPHWLSHPRIESLFAALGLASLPPAAAPMLFLLLSIAGAMLLSLMSLHVLERPILRIAERLLARAPERRVLASSN